MCITYLILSVCCYDIHQRLNFVVNLNLYFPSHRQHVIAFWKFLFNQMNTGSIGLDIWRWQLHEEFPANGDVSLYAVSCSSDNKSMYDLSSQVEVMSCAIVELTFVLKTSLDALYCFRILTSSHVAGIKKAFTTENSIHSSLLLEDILNFMLQGFIIKY